MKVCHLTSVHPYLDIRIFMKQCRTLVSSGYEVHLVAPDAPNEIIDGVQMHTIVKSKASRMKRMTKTVSDVYKKAKEINADIYHFHDPELMIVGYLLSKVQGKRVIYDVHEDVPRQIMSKTWIPKSLRFMISKTVEFIENRLSRKYSAVVTATPFINKRFEGLIKTSVNINNFPINGELLVTNSDVYEKERAVCYVGGISTPRGINEMVYALNNVDAQLYLCGRFSSEKDRMTLTKIDGWSKVKEMGFLNREQVSDICSKSIAGLVLFHPEPNHVNAQPNKLFEYMSAGIPVISSDFHLWKEIIEGNRCGICVNPLDPTAITNAIQYLIDNPEEVEIMGRNGKRAVEEKYNWSSEGEKLLKLYRSLK